MTPEQLKARELIIKFQFQKHPLMFDDAKKFALICVDEMKKDRHTLLVKLFDKVYADAIIDSVSKDLEKIKSELENL